MSSSSLGQKIIQGSSAGLVATLIHMLSRLLLIPLILHFVPLAHYGLWSVCFMVLSYAGMSAFGVQNAYIRYGSQYTAQGNMPALNVLMSTGLTLMGCVCLSLFLILMLGFPLVMDLFEVSKTKWELAQFMLLGTSVAFFLELWLGAFKALLEGMQEIALTRAVWLSATLLEVLVVIVLLFLGLGIKGVMYAYVLKTLWEMGLDLILALRKVPSLRLRPMFKREAFEALFVYGGKVQVLGMVGIFLKSFDRLVASALVGLEAVGLFEVGRKLPFTARGISRSAFAPFLPAASSMDHNWEDSPQLGTKERIHKYLGLALSAALLGLLVIGPACLYLAGRSSSFWHSPAAWTGIACCALLVWPGMWAARRMKGFFHSTEYIRAPQVEALYVQGSRHMTMINGILYIFLFAAAEELLHAWVGPGYDQAVPITRIVALTAFVHLQTGIGTSIFKGVNRVGRELEYMIVQLVLALVCIPFLTWQFGLYGAVAGYSLSVIPASFYFLIRTNTAFCLAHRAFFALTLRPLMIPLAAGLGVWFCFQVLPPFSRIVTLGEIGVLGAAYCAVSVWGLKKWFLTREEWITLMSSIPVLKGLHKLKPSHTHQAQSHEKDEI